MNLLLLGLSASAWATAPDLYGFGARNVALTGAGAALADDAFGSFTNPAGIGQIGRFTLDAGFLGAQAQLRPFENIIYDVDGDGDLVGDDGRPDTGPVGTDYNARGDGTRVPLQTSALQVGLVFPIGQFVTAGLAAHLPTESLLRVQTQDPALPYYPMYRYRNDRFYLAPALSVRPVRGLWIGAGAQLMADAAISARASVYADVAAFPADAQPGDPELTGQVKVRIEDMQIAAKTRAAPNLGVLFNLGALAEHGSPAWDTLRHFSVGAAYRGAWGVNSGARIDATVNGRIRFDDQTVLLSQLTNGPVSVQLDDLVAFYNPPQVQFGLRGGTPAFTAVADLAWTGWSGFRELSPPFSQMSIDSLAGVALDVEIGEDLGEPGWKDTLSPRLGVEVHPEPIAAGKLFGTLGPKARVGFQYAPTPVPDQTGRTSYMDSDRWTLGLGLGVEAKQIQGFTKGPVKFDVAAAYQHVTRREVAKDPSLVADTNGDGFLDYPYGFPVNGSLISQGRALSFSANLSFSFDAVRSRDAHGPAPRAAAPAGDKP